VNDQLKPLADNSDSTFPYENTIRWIAYYENIKKFDQEVGDLARRLKMEVNTHHEAAVRKRVAVLVTKEAHCLEALLGAHKKKQLKGEISVIIGTEKTLSPLARRSKISFVLVNDVDQSKAEEKILSILKRYNIDLIVLARYMRILSPNFVWRYPNRVINIHPSLLPAFPGAFAYMQAYERGAKIVGCTAHYVTEDLDQGPIIFQDAFAIDSPYCLRAFSGSVFSRLSSSVNCCDSCESSSSRVFRSLLGKHPVRRKKTIAKTRR